MNLIDKFFQKFDSNFKGKIFYISTDEVYGSLGNSGYFTEKTPYQPNSLILHQKQVQIILFVHLEKHKLPYLILIVLTIMDRINFLKNSFHYSLIILSTLRNYRFTVMVIIQEIGCMLGTLVLLISFYIKSLSGLIILVDLTSGKILT